MARENMVIRFIEKCETFEFILSRWILCRTDIKMNNYLLCEYLLKMRGLEVFWAKCHLRNPGFQQLFYLARLKYKNLWTRCPTCGLANFGFGDPELQPNFECITSFEFQFPDYFHASRGPRHSKNFSKCRKQDWSSWINTELNHNPIIMK